ncbi:MAG: hypothetical protein AB1626_05125 [Candidatus Micrarchaeota archaeon]
MKYFAILLVLAVSLLAFGCVGGGPQAPQGPGAQASPTGVQQVGQATASPQPLAGLGYEQLLASGQPVECTVTIAREGAAPTTARAFFKSGKMRVESTEVRGEESIPLVVITKEERLYVEVRPDQKANLSEQLGTACDWLVFETNATDGEAGAASAEEVAEAPSEAYSCNYAVFGDEKFVTPGEACNFRELFEQAWERALEAMPSPEAEAPTPSVDAETLEAVCSNPQLSAEVKSAMGCP